MIPIIGLVDDNTDLPPPELLHLEGHAPHALWRAQGLARTGARGRPVVSSRRIAVLRQIALELMRFHGIGAPAT